MTPLEHARSCCQLLLIAGLAGCQAPQPESGAELLPGILEGIASGAARVVDLTHPLSSRNPYWPGPDDEPFSYETFATIDDGAGKYHLENAANRGELPPTGAWAVVAPIRIEGGTGGPARVFALVRN